MITTSVRLPPTALNSTVTIVSPTRVAGVSQSQVNCRRRAGNVAVLADGDVRIAVAAGHAEAVLATDAQIDAGAAERPAVAFHPPPVLQFAGIRPRVEQRIGIRLNDS